MKNQPLSAWSYAIISFIALLIAVILLFNLNNLTSQSIVAKYYYVLLIPLGLSSAAFLFGVMKSYARFSGKVTNSNIFIELGGPVVVACLVVFGGFKLIPQEDNLPFSLTVFVHGRKGIHDIVLKNQGQVMMDLGGHRRTESIGDKGDAYFPEIPPNFLNNEIGIAVIADGIEPAYPEKKYLLKSGSIYIEVVEIKTYPQKYQIDTSLDTAKSLLDIDKYSEAKKEYEKILKSDPANQIALSGLEKVRLYELLANPQSDTGVIEQRLKSFKNQNPDDPHVHVLLGNLYAISGKYKKAETYYQTAVKWQDSTASAWYGLGTVYHKQNMLAESVKMYEKAVSLSGSNIEYLNNLAYLYSETRQYPKSIETYQQILKLESRLLNPYFGITDILRLTGKLQQALKNQETLINLFKDSQAVNMPYNQEVWYFKTENDEIQISEMLEKQVLAYYKMALTLYLSGKENKAEQYLEAIRGVQGDKHNVLTILNHHLKKLVENQPLLREAIEKFRTKL
ncbi:MAG: tetratricopeptide repeat protein [Desulfobacterales bacterium]|nr:tetratricopeptide repeat protein [Desulfobacterales bacterium]